MKTLAYQKITDNKKSWKTVSPLFRNKVKTNQKINLIEKNILVTSDEEIAKNLRNILIKLCQSST